MKKAFTLIELIVVIAIVAVLAAVITPNVFRQIERARQAQYIANVNAVKTAMQSLYADTGRFASETRYYSYDYGSGYYEYFWVDIESPWSSSGFWADYTELLQDPADYGYSMLGWDGPYLDRTTASPWGGVAFVYGWYDSGWGSPEIYYETMHDYCDGTWTWPAECGPSRASAERLDEAVDDGDLYTGNFRGWGNPPYYLYWRIFSGLW